MEEAGGVSGAGDHVAVGGGGGGGNRGAREEVDVGGGHLGFGFLVAAMLDLLKVSLEHRVLAFELNHTLLYGTTGYINVS